MGSLLTILLSIAGLWTAPYNAPVTPCQCTCIVSGEDEDIESVVSRAYAQTDAIFVGTVSSKHVMEDNTIGARLSFTLTVDKALKGISTTVVQVRTGKGGGDCGFDFHIGQTYLVYAVHGRPGTEIAGQLFTSICSRTVHARDRQARKDLRILRRKMQ